MFSRFYVVPSSATFLILAFISLTSSHSIDFRQRSPPSSVTPLSTKGVYPVIFEDAGKLALSNAFLHILIPLNLTQIRFDIEKIRHIICEAIKADHKLYTPNSYYDTLIKINEDQSPASNNFMTRLNEVHKLFSETVGLLPDSRQVTLDEKLFIENPSLMPLAPLRRKRNLALLLPFLKEAVGTFWGLFGKPALSALMSSVASGQRPNNVLLAVNTNGMKRITQVVDKVATTIQGSQALMTKNREFYQSYPMYSEAISTLERQISKVVNVIQQLNNHRLSVDWLSGREIEAIHHAIETFAKANDITPLTSTYADYFQIETSYVRDGYDVTAILHVPCAGGKELLSILRFVPAPIPLPVHERSFRTISATFQSLTQYPITENFTEALYIKPEADLIAIGSSTAYKTLSLSDLDACIKKNSIYVCDKPNFLRTKLSNSCVGALYEKNKEATLRHCHYEKRPFTEAVFQIESSSFIVYSPVRFTARFSCKRNSYTADITEANRIYVANECTLPLLDHVLQSSNHYTMTGETEITNWEFDPLLAPVGRLIDNGELLLSETTTTEPPVIDPTIYATNEELYHAILALASASFLSILYPLFLVCKCLTHHCRRQNVVDETWRNVPRNREVVEVPMQQVYANHPPIVPRHSCVKQ
jgi:hypothetical protein